MQGLMRKAVLLFDRRRLVGWEELFGKFFKGRWVVKGDDGPGGRTDRWNV